MGDAEVDMDIFLAGCLRLKGPASSIDVHTLGLESKMMHRLQKNFFSFMEKRFMDIEEQVQSIKNDHTPSTRCPVREVPDPWGALKVSPDPLRGTMYSIASCT